MTIAPSIPLPGLSRVAVLGAGGASGLAAVAQLLDKGARPDQIVGYEARSTAGGVWNYDGDAGECQAIWSEDGTLLLKTEKEIYDAGRNGPTAVYDELRTNLPAECMTFRNAPHPDGTPIFPTHRGIASYLQNYAKDRELLPLIQFSTLVRQVFHTSGNNDNSKRWTVVAEREDENGQIIHDSQYFIVTNGHFNVPFIPSVPGLNTWRGKLLHSRWWRDAKSVRGRNIVVIGSHASGTDIARDIALDDEASQGSLRKIYQSAREKQKARPNEDQEEQTLYPNTKWKDHVEIVPVIEKVEGDKIYLKGGRILEDVDTLLFATGYLYSKSTPEERALSAGPANRPINLDVTDTFYAPDPTLSFIGLHRFVNPFPLFERSARLIAHCYTRGEIPSLPPLRRDSDIPGDLNIGHPQEFENQDDWLRAIGEVSANVDLPTADFIGR
uniref:FAD/NAD(P)-binding domain-containing protein n=1 Tax=Kwoniella pini CBS 10737 TaxID=1296096 RepID=A0A1B9HT85_9TREE|nr:uncharacterized protein I206_07335 [Kwoniella pini CBS 10737]OCF46482.1 hypothetical protein I206_07335 [Kwoniella pini CBS 10737]